MDSFSAVIAAFGKPSVFDAETGAPAGSGRTWKYRNAIPAEHWRATVDAARRRGIAGVTFERLAALAEDKKTRRMPPAHVERDTGAP